MINIAERPAEAGDRAVPGHWEGDLIIGKNNASAIGTLVDRSTGIRCSCTYPTAIRPNRSATRSPPRSRRCPRSSKASLTWDQGQEMRDWKQVSVDADIDIYSCDQHAPCNAPPTRTPNGLLRQYFPKGTDLSIHSTTDLDWVATELNDRPRKRLGFNKPIGEIGPLLLQ
jgi:transposase, IS30 family